MSISMVNVPTQMTMMYSASAALCRRRTIVAALALLPALTSCSDFFGPDKKEPKKSGFGSPEEFIDNPSIRRAVSESSIPIYNGSDPPPLIGDYRLRGEVLDASPSVRSLLVGEQLNSLITLYNQTTAGRISFRERVGSLTAWGSGGYVTGTSGTFTIWQESVQSGEEAGLPSGVTIHVSLIVSGTKQTSGNLTAQGLSVVTRVISADKDYLAAEGVWWRHSSTLELMGPPTARVVGLVQSQGPTTCCAGL